MSGGTLSASARRAQAALEGKAAPDLDLDACMAWQRTTRRIAAPAARELGHDPKTYQDYGNVESGDTGPHLVLLLVTKLALAWKRDRAEAFAALDFVERHLGRIAFEVPTSAPATVSDLARRIAHATVQLGEFVEALAAGPVSPEQVARAHQEKQDIYAALEALWPSAPASPSPTNDGDNVHRFESRR